MGATKTDEAGAGGTGAGAESFTPPAAPSRLALGLALGAVVLFNLPMIHYFLLRPKAEATVQVPFQDDFQSPATVATNYWSEGGLWRVENGQLLSPGVKNNPLWLKAKLPRDVAVEFDARSMSPEGDIKCEIFGDGVDHASGYVLIHGGWNNSLSIISRLDEHGAALPALQNEANRRAQQHEAATNDLRGSGVYQADTRTRVEANPYRVELGRTYHWRIERKGARISWFIDGAPFMQFDDPIPLEGPGHDRFGFSSWEAQLYFDNLKITPL